MSSSHELRDEPLDEAIRLEGLMPLTWRPSIQPLTESELLSASESNVSLLDAIMIMDMPTSLDNEERDVSALEIHRLQAKVDLLVSMVSRLLSYHEQQPLSMMVSLSAQRVSWQGALPVQVGNMGMMDVFVHPLTRSPLQLPVVVRSNQHAEIVGLQPTALNALEKFLFRQHRRQVAGARHAKTT